MFNLISLLTVVLKVIGNNFYMFSFFFLNKYIVSCEIHFLFIYLD